MFGKFIMTTYMVLFLWPARTEITWWIFNVFFPTCFPKARQEAKRFRNSAIVAKMVLSSGLSGLKPHYERCMSSFLPSLSDAENGIPCCKTALGDPMVLLSGPFALKVSKRSEHVLFCAWSPEMRKMGFYVPTQHESYL
jgi:hypothetical protein